jgi:hypothetical protein
LKSQAFLAGLSYVFEEATHTCQKLRQAFGSSLLGKDQETKTAAWPKNSELIV